MKKRIIAVLAIVLCISLLSGTIALAGIFDTIADIVKASQKLEEVPHLVSYTEFAGAYPDEITVQDDERMAYTYHSVAENDFFGFGDYLEECGWTMDVDTVKEGQNGYEIPIANGENTILVIYDPNAWVLTLVYPEGYAARGVYGDIQIGSVVEFGNYQQNADGKDKTPIQWLVLDIDYQNNRMLLTSLYGLEARAYNDLYVHTTWEECSLRAWLNNDFLNRAFNEEEQKAILTTVVDNGPSQCYDEWITSGGNDTQDKIFLLSYAEAKKYFGLDFWMNDKEKGYPNKSARLQPTAYAIAQGASVNPDYKTEDGEASGWWWLRSPGFIQDFAAIVITAGSLRYYYVDYAAGSVRPTLWVDLTSGIF